MTEKRLFSGIIRDNAYFSKILKGEIIAEYCSCGKCKYPTPNAELFAHIAAIGRSIQISGKKLNEIQVRGDMQIVLKGTELETLTLKEGWTGCLKGVIEYYIQILG